MPIQKLDPALITQAQEAVKQYGSVIKAAKALGIARSTLQHRVNAAINLNPLTPSAPATFRPLTVQQKVGKSLSDFRAAHDKDYIIPKKIKAALQQLGNGWEYEVDFLRIAQVSTTDLALYRDRFVDNWLVVDRSGKRVWAGTKSLADEMRSMVRG
jgi:hypothetical protein